MNFVKFGRKSAKLDYTLGADGTATAAFDERPIPSAPPTPEPELLGVRGDGSGNTDVGADHRRLRHCHDRLRRCTVDFTGWKQLSVTLPGGRGRPSHGLHRGHR
jgi:hypothetical protein